MSMLADNYKKYDKKTAAISTALLLTVLSVTGCSTTPEFKPTATVMVGAQTSL